MAQPVWITPAGDLGTIPEGIFYQSPLLAYDPSETQELFYRIIAGQLPAGIQCEANGLIAGIPKAIASVQGVPTEVSQDVSSKFTVRAYTTRVVNGATVVDRLADRTFTLTVAGQDEPEFVTPAGNIATYFDGSLVSALQIQYTDTDPADLVVIRLVAGALPPGLTISSTGLISGFIAPNTDVGLAPGYSRDGQGYSQYPFDFTTRSSTVNYEFVLEVGDGKASNLRTFQILVYSRNSCTADNTQLTADNTFVTADSTPTRVPIILTTQGTIGTVRNDNFFAFQFQGLDLDGDPYEFVINTTPPGLTFDPGTGWLYGYIPNLGITENTYNFNLRIFKSENPTVISNTYSYSLTIIGPIDTDITWLTASDLGYIDNGSVSTLYVEAVNRGDLELQYRLESGTDSQLPQGLQLLPSGEIAGTVSFNTFAVDGGTTTFDVESYNRFNPLLNQATTLSTETTFDLKYTFTVNAYSINGVVSVFRTFYITVVRKFNEPFDNIYIQAMPPVNDRVLLDSLLQNVDIFPPALLYRPDDFNFGLAKNVTYYHAYGLTAATLDEYVQALDLNHYWKNLTLGEIMTAQAIDPATGEVIYEIVYSQINDNLVNNDGVSVGKEVTLAYPVNPNTPDTISTVYPNSLVDMRTQVIDSVGQVSNALPLWMTSKQADGKVLGFVPAWIIAYTKPTKSGQIAYNIKTIFGEILNQIDYKVDRYELDRSQSHNWDTVTKEWVPDPAETSFDINNHYQITDIATAGSGYAVGNQIRISGSDIGGVDGLNDVVVTVSTVNTLGGILEVFYQGTAPALDPDSSYTGISGTNISGSGIGAVFDLETVPGVVTEFDGGSVRFIAPVNVYTNTQVYNKYLLFPKRNIIGDTLVV